MENAFGVGKPATTIYGRCVCSWAKGVLWIDRAGWVCVGLLATQPGCVLTVKTMAVLHLHRWRLILLWPKRRFSAFAIRRLRLWTCFDDTSFTSLLIKCLFEDMLHLYIKLPRPRCGGSCLFSRGLSDICISLRRILYYHGVDELRRLVAF